MIKTKSTACMQFSKVTIVTIVQALPGPPHFAGHWLERLVPTRNKEGLMQASDRFHGSSGQPTCAQIPIQVS